MLNPTLTKAISLAVEHDRNIDNILAVHKSTRKELTKQMMIDPTKVLPHLLKEVYYLDAYTKLVNEENYVPDREFWTAKHYLEDFLSAFHKWLDDHGEDLTKFFLEEQICQGITDDDNEIFQAVLMAVLGRRLRIDDEGQQQPKLLTFDGDGSSGSEQTERDPEA